MTRVVVNTAAIELLERSLVDDLLPIGEQVADRAAAAAPRDTGEGAGSIRAEVVDDEVRVSWDRTHFYMLFSEVGTSKMNARPFLRPALDAQYDV